MADKVSIVLVGGGGHCRSVIDVINSTNRYKIEGILDPNLKTGTEIFGFPVIGGDDLIANLAKSNRFVITVGQVGNCKIRSVIYEKIKNAHGILENITSPRAYVSPYSYIGEGTVVMHDAVINCGAIIGVNCIINTKALIEHDVSVGDHCHISTASVVNGDAIVREYSMIGSNSIVVNGTVFPTNQLLRANQIFGAKGSGLCVGVVVYPMPEDIFMAYVDSLVAQSNKSFDLLVVNDGYGDLRVLHDSLPESRIVEIEPQGSIAKNREKLISEIVSRGYEMAVMTDADDVSSINRIERSLALLKRYDLVINDLDICYPDGSVAKNYVSKRVRSGSEIEIHDISKLNFAGLGNTSFRVSIVSRMNVDFPDDLLAVDWYFYSLMMMSGAKAIFDSVSSTSYRQWSANTVGISTVSKEKALGVRAQVKKYLSREGHRLPDKQSRENILFNKAECLNNPLWWEVDNESD